jgi:hypothetical protein
MSHDRVKNNKSISVLAVCVICCAAIAFGAMFTDWYSFPRSVETTNAAFVVWGDTSISAWSAFGFQDIVLTLCLLVIISAGVYCLMDGRYRAIVLLAMACASIIVVVTALLAVIDPPQPGPGWPKFRRTLTIEVDVKTGALVTLSGGLLALVLSIAAIVRTRRSVVKGGSSGIDRSFGNADANSLPQ